MGVSFELKGRLSPRMNIQAQLGLKRIKGTGPFHFVPIEDIGTSPEGVDPSTLLVSYQKIMAKTQSIQVGCNADRASGPLTDQAVYFCLLFLTHDH